MMTLNLIPGLTPMQITLICDWTNQQGSDYLTQWAGREVAFPLMHDVVSRWQHVYAICQGDELLGMIQVLRREGENLHIGRFMISPLRVGQGFGKQALSCFLNLLFADSKIQTISLHVFASNRVAIRLYEAIGFQIVQVLNTPVTYYRMQYRR